MPRWFGALAALLSIAIFAPALAAKPLSVRDDLGRTMLLPRAPRRIISLAPSVTEILFAVGAEKRLVADTAYCDYPDAAKRLPHVGGVIDPNPEKIAALHPDLIILASQTLPAAEADALARKWRTPVFVTAAATYLDVERDIAALGRLAGDARRTQALLHAMERTRRDTARLVQGKPKPRAFLIVWQHPLMTAGGGSFLGDLVRRAGGVNVAERAGDYPNYSPERLLKDDPDVLLMPMGSERRTAGSVTFPLARSLRAICTGRVVALPADAVNRPGPRLRFGLIAVARALHPEAYR